MALKITVPNSSSENLTFGSAQTPVAAEVVGIDSGSSNGQLAFKTTSGGASTERMRIDASGNVGIGTSSPLAKLDSRGNVLVGTNPTGDNVIGFGNTSSLGGALTGAPSGMYGNTFIVGNSSVGSGAPGYMGFWTTSGGVVAERMRINSVGSREYARYGSGSLYAGDAVIGWDNASSTTFDLSTLFPDLTGYASGVTLNIQVFTWTGVNNTATSTLINGARGGTLWAFSSVNAIGNGAAITTTGSGSGNVVTLSFSSANYGTAKISIATRN